MRRILINATQPEEVRVAIVNGQKLENLDIEHAAAQQKKSNVYKGIITRVEPSLEAAFVNYGGNRHGFLPFKEIARSYIDTDEKNEHGRLNVKDGIKEGQEIIVQVEKEERGNKGAALTTYISLAGRYLVLIPNNPRAGGVSRRIEGEARAAIRACLAEMSIPKGMGTIVRTAGVGRNTEELQWDLDYQINIWKAIQKAAEEKPAPFLIYQESSLIVRALRDYYRSDIGEILIDNKEVYQEAEVFVEQCMPQNRRKLKFYQEATPLFNRFQIETQIESAFNREVQLPSGGAIVIDHTEALISIDVNSARATKGGDIEETATNTNLEAADEVARQVRLRDIGGLIVIDFIDMLSAKNQRLVENRLKEALKMDRARVQIGRISRFGLMEMSRQRLKPSLGESAQLVCPRCSGSGKIRGIESLALSILRIMEDEAMKDNTKSVVAKVPVNVATFLLNEKRSNITESEERNHVRFLIIPNENLETPHFTIERVKSNEANHETDQKSSYDLSDAINEPYTPSDAPVAATPDKAAVSSVAPSQPVPRHIEKKDTSGGLWEKIMALFLPKKEEVKPQKSKPQNRNRGRRGNYRNNNRNRNQPRSQYNRKRDSHYDNKKQEKNTSKPKQTTNKKQNERTGRNNQQGQNNSANNRKTRDNTKQQAAKQQKNQNTTQTEVKPQNSASENMPAANNAVKENPQAKQAPKVEKTKQENIPKTEVKTETKVSKKQLSDYSSSVKSLAETKATTEKAD